MAKKWFFVAGAGIGYVLGTRAGRQKYEAMVAKARDVLDRPDVKEVKQVVQAKAQRLYDEGRELLRSRARAGREADLEAGTDPAVGQYQSTSYGNGVRPTPSTTLPPLASGE